MQQTLNSTPHSSPILWPQVCGLAVVQGAIALTWVIYNLYLSDLLVQVGLPAAWARGLLILENLLGILMEPMMGTFSDRAQRWVGSRFPFIAIGMILSSVCFLLIPFTVSLLVSTVPLDATLEGVMGLMRLALPAILVAWALAMTVFRSPALSLLGRYAFATGLPQAASILTLVGGVAGAMGPLANQMILGLGAMTTFLIGSVVLVVAALVLRSTEPHRSVAEVSAPTPTGEQSLNSETFSWPGLATVFGTGVGVALGFRLMMGKFPGLLTERIPEINTGAILGLIFISLAATAIPAGKVGSWLGNRLAMMLGIGAMAVLLGSTIFLQGRTMAMAIALGLGAAFSLVSNGTIPFALSMVPPNKAGLGTGIFFSGGAAANSLFGLYFSQSGAISPGLGLGLGALAFLGSGVCILISAPFQMDSSHLRTDLKVLD